MDESAVILKWGLHYQVVGYDVWLGEMLLAMGILILFGILNILGVKKAGIVQTILAALLGISVVTLTIAALVSSKTSLSNMAPWWGFHKSDVIAAWTNGNYTSIDKFANSGTVGAGDTVQHAAGSRTRSGGKYARRSSACHGIRKHPVRCRFHAGRRWLPFASEFLGCDTAIGALINLLKHPSAAYLVVDAKK